MRKPIILLLLLLPLLSLCGRELTISTVGHTDYIIVLPDNPAPVLQTAATELATYLNQVTGAQFPIHEGHNAPAGRPALRIACAAHQNHKWNNDETAITFDGTDICFCGQMPRGPLYAVYHFLENYVGIRWWTAEECDIPSKPTLTVQAEDYRFAPPFWYREDHYYDPNTNPRFAARLKVNGHFHKIPEELGGHHWLIGWSHTLGQMLPASKYFKDHPDWYGMVDGKRQIPNHYQFCLSNPEMRAALVRKALERVRANPEAGIISISQNDGGTPCQCPECRAIDEEEGSPAGLMLRVCNEVAAAINQEYPDFLVVTLAYTYTRKPPRITRPAKNVAVQLCSIESNFAQSLEHGKDNQDFAEDLRQWSAIAPLLYVGNYLANFTNYMQPHPNYRNIGNDLRFFAQNHVFGCFEQGDTHCVTGDFPRMRAWVVAHLLWDPFQDQRALMSEFLNGYYGAAGPRLLDYLDYLCDAVEKARVKNGYKLGIFNKDVSQWMDVKVMNRAMRLYAKAEEAVRNQPVFAARVRRERLTLDQVCLRILPMMLRRNRLDGTPIPLHVEDHAKMANEFVELTAHTLYIREHGLFGDYAKGLRDSLLLAMDENAKIPEFCKGLPADGWDIFPVTSYVLAGKGTWVDLVDDPDALHGKAARLAGNTNQWAIQRAFTASLYDANAKWKLVFRAKLDAAATDGKALSFGICDTSSGRNLLDESVPVRQFADANGGYIRIDSRPFTMQGTPYIFFAPPQRPLAEVKHISIDAVLLVRLD